MKNSIYTYVIGLIFISFSFSCKKEAPDQWLQDNIDIIGKVPVITSFKVNPPQTTNVAAGSGVVLDLRYWSDEEIDKINLKAAVGGNPQEQVSSTPYQKAYSEISRTDSLLMPYQVPGGLAVGTAISLEVEVVNKNTLTKKSTLNLKVQ